MSAPQHQQGPKQESNRYSKLGPKPPTRAGEIKPAPSPVENRRHANIEEANDEHMEDVNMEDGDYQMRDPKANTLIYERGNTTISISHGTSPDDLTYQRCEEPVAAKSINNVTTTRGVTGVISKFWYGESNEVNYKKKFDELEKRSKIKEESSASEIEYLKKQIENCARDVENRQRINDKRIKGLENSYRKDLALLKDQNARAQKEMEQQVRKAQEVLIKDSERRSNLAGEDGNIRAMLKRLRDDVNDWGKAWAIDNIAEIEKLPEETKNPLLHELSNVVCLENGRIPACLSSENMVTKAPRLLILSLVSHMICKFILESPFATLEPSDPKLGVSILDIIYWEISQFDIAGAQAWRRQTLSHIDPMPGRNGVVAQAHEKQRKRMSSRRTAAAAALAEMFINGPAKELMKKEQQGSSSDRDAELLAVVQQAFEVAGLIWTQPSMLRCEYLERLERQRFSCNSPYMEGHPLHQMEADDTRLDGHAVRIVVAPLIRAFGDSFSENYDKDRVWAKAIVWLDE